MKRNKRYIAICFWVSALLLPAAAVSAQDPGQSSAGAAVSPENPAEGKDPLHRSLRNRIDGGVTPQSELTGAISAVDVEAISKYPDLNLTNVLQGQAAGLVVRSAAGSLTAGSSINIRGLHAFDTNSAIVVIDGVERPMDDLFVEEIESIEILKDASAKVIYGPSAANGVVLITTRRGVEGKQVIRASAEYGLSTTAFMADYLDSHTYATLYNEARTNDGMQPMYLPHQLEGYRNSTGANDLLYPDVDHKDRLLRNTMDYTRVSFDINGGTQSILYAINAGYMGGSGLEKAGERLHVDKLNLRANLDIVIADFLKVKADIAGRMWIQNRGVVWGTDVFSAISTHRPNEYPLTIDPGVIGVVPNEGGVPTFGGSQLYKNNIYADMAYGGSANERYTTSQANLGVDFDLGRFVEGLTADAYITMDNYNYLSQQLKNTYATYAVETYLDANGDMQMRSPQLLRENLPKNNSINGHTLRRTFGWRASVGYRNTFGENSFSAMAAARYMKSEFAGLTQDRINAIYSLRLNYDYDKRYFAEVILAGMGNNKFEDGNKYFLSPVLSAGWVVSNEDFMRSFDAVDYLKLKASYGILGYGASTEYNLSKSAWLQSGTIGMSERNTSSEYLISLVRMGNPDLKWESSEEINVGVEWSALRDRLYGELNYFNEHHRDIIGTDGAIYTDIQGAYAVATNMGETRNRGVDLSVNWRDVSGDLSYDVGLNFLYSNDKIIRCGELAGIEDARKRTGRSSGAMFGLNALGLFGRDVDLGSAPLQAYGHYQNGDIAYADRTGDGVVDDRDMVMLGRNFPTAVWGLRSNLRYRNWGLYVLATAETGASIWMTGSYFQNYGEGKYSTLAADRYHEANNPNGKYPRLTTTAATNNRAASSFWAEKADFLRLKNVELSYTFVNTRGALKDAKVFLRGTNLAVLTGVEDVDPEMPLAGVVAYPAYSTYTLGLTVTF